ncbi:MAG: hypothetical protein VB064_14440 [Oscillospiraceae bacterium]|nr:hypothetical protein [Oscillospiraceae bacterium]
MQKTIAKKPNTIIPKDIASTNASTAFHVKTQSIAKKIKQPIIQTAEEIKTNGEYLLKLQQVGLS